MKFKNNKHTGKTQQGDALDRDEAINRQNTTKERSGYKPSNKHTDKTRECSKHTHNSNNTGKTNEQSGNKYYNKHISTLESSYQ